MKFLVEGHQLPFYLDGAILEGNHKLTEDTLQPFRIDPNIPRRVKRTTVSPPLGIPDYSIYDLFYEPEKRMKFKKFITEEVASQIPSLSKIF